MKSKTLVLGRHGQLASELWALKGSDADFVFAGRDQIDAHRPELVTRLIEDIQPAVVINCTAYVQFDLAESHVDECRLLNVDFVKHLADLSVKAGFHLVHFSSDYVFDGRQSKPYVETDPSHPLSVYGQSKRDGELAVLNRAKSAAIVRTAWLYSASGHNFLKTMLKLAETPKPLRVVNDQRGCPTWTRDLANATLSYFAHPTPGQVELYHYAGGGEATWFEFATAIMSLWETSKTVEPISSGDFPAAGERPKYSVLSTEKFQSRSGLKVPDWRTSLQKCRGEWGRA